MFKKIFFLSFILLFSSVFSQDSTVSYTDSLLFKKFNKYKLLYNVNCVQDKITNNQGNGFEDLYGTRNFLHRGGGNNYYHRTNKRSNKKSITNRWFKKSP